VIARPALDPDYIVAKVHQTGRATRFDTDNPADPSMPEIVRAERIHSGVASPIVVEGELWGAFTIASRDGPLLGGVEHRLADFTALVAIAIANADSRDQLISSRTRLLTAGDDARRRVVRDLHDGAQQRLVHTIVTLKLAQRAYRDEAGEGESLLSEALEQAEQSNSELRELAHGILPSVLTRGGLRAGVDAVVARVNLPVRVDVPDERLPPEIEASGYFIVAEALTNVVKHSHAGRAEVTASVEDGMLRIEVRDNGAGGVDPDGHGLVGMRDRVMTLGGRLEIKSPARGGTLVAATLPLSAG
jgi:signal transduction histidine kinase